jgi:predicted nuclease with TOPRIM domain
MTEFISLAAITFIIGIIAGWIITRMKFKSQIDVLREKNGESVDIIVNLKGEVESLRSGLQSESTVKTRAESDLKNSMEMISELQNNVKELTQLREQYSTVKTKYEKLMFDSIELSNERSRLKSQIEDYRIKEM